MRLKPSRTYVSWEIQNFSYTQTKVEGLSWCIRTSEYVFEHFVANYVSWAQDSDYFEVSKFSCKQKEQKDKHRYEVGK